MKEKKLIIFDFDGVIYNSEELHFKSFNFALEDLEKTITREVYYAKYCSFDDEGFFKGFLNDNKINFQDELINDLISKKHEYFDANFDNETSIYDDCVDLIKVLSKSFILAIGSGARREEIVRILKRENLLDVFEVIVSSDETTYPKPNPETYLMVLDGVNETYQVLPEECIVIEDTPKGVDSAISSGMKCFAITNSVSSTELSNSDKVFTRCKDITIEEITQI